MNQRDMLFFRYQIDFFFNNFMRLNMVNHLLWHITACFTSFFYDGCEKGCTFCQKLHLLLPPKKGDKWRLNVIRISFFFFCRLELLTKKCPLEFLMKTTFSVSVETTLMLVYLHCQKPVFTPKMAIFRRAGIREGGLPLPLAFQYLILLIWRPYDLNLVMIS